MHADWTKTSTALPAEGTLVEFLLDERNCPMRGTYATGRFESRWNGYPPPSVNQWRVIASAGEALHPMRSAALNSPLHAWRRANEPGSFGGLAIGAA